jgi:LacI family transcriptional regulator
MNRRIRIKDIAEKTGVSIGTVDRVIHNRGHVAAEVRQRVLQAMEKMGYEPNILARTLANNRLFRIAAILPDYRLDPYWVQPKEGVEKAAESVSHYGVKVEFSFFHLFQESEFQKRAAEVLANKPDAILVAPVFRKEGEMLLEKAAELEIPVVTINTNLEGAHCLCYIGQESYQSGVLAGRLLNFGLNDHDQAMVLNLDKSVTNARHLQDKERGFRDFFSGIRDKNIFILSEIFEDFDSPAALRQFMQEQMEQHPRLRGVFVTNSRAYKLAECLHASQLKQIKIVGFDLVEPNLRLLDENKIRFLINQNAWQQGYLGILAIVNSIILKKEVGHHQYLPLDIVVRENVDYYLKRTLEMPMLVV